MSGIPYDELSDCKKENNMSDTVSSLKLEIPNNDTKPRSTYSSNSPKSPKANFNDVDLATLQSRPKLGPFAIVKTIGEGSFGKVKLAIHVETGQKVALKFINRKSLKRPDMSSRVDREIAYLKLLRHPHIIRLYDVITTPIDIIMVIEYASRELFDYIVQNGRMDEDTARRFFQQIITAVEYCHRHKIVHRDLKPENLLLDDDLNVKIADFGLSNLMTDGEFLKTSCGSPNYAAPEVVGGKLYAGPEVDVWSCGVILYVMLVGRLPFDDDFIPNLFKKISNGIYNLPSWLPVGPKELLKNMLVVDSMQRITMQEILQDPWFVQNLPEYLQPTQLDEEKSSADPLIMSLISKVMGISVEDVQAALGEKDMNVIKEAYEVMLENKALAQKGGRNFDAEYKSPGVLASPDLNNPDCFDSSHVSPMMMPFTILEDNVQKANSGAQSTQSQSASNISPNSPFVNVSGHLDVSFAAGGKYRDDQRASNIRILKSSLPSEHMKVMSAHLEGEYIPEELADEDVLKSKFELLTIRADQKPRSKSSASRQPSISTVDHLASSANTTAGPTENATGSSVQAKKQKPSRWHFGIRSRSPPFEVLSEIYKALQTLGAEFKEGNIEVPKDDSQCSATEPSNDKTKFDPYFIRCRINKYELDDQGVQTEDGCRVYMDVQLYAIDRECFLVDFKCAGYEAIKKPSSSSIKKQGISRARTMYSRTKPDSNLKQRGSSNQDDSDQAIYKAQERLASRSSEDLKHLGNHIVKESNGIPIHQGKEKKVNSPFPFLEIAAMVIQNLI